MGLIFILNSALLGAALAMDAFSVSMANGFAEPGMGRGRRCTIAGVYALFQFAMPMAGWVIVNIAVSVFSVLEKAIPYIALILLIFVGAKMIRDGSKRKDGEDGNEYTLTNAKLFLQGVATSIDALSVGLTIAAYSWYGALLSSLIIAAVTFLICMGGLSLGSRIGTALSGRAVIGGGILLILIGIEIFIRGIF